MPPRKRKAAEASAPVVVELSSDDEPAADSRRRSRRKQNANHEPMVRIGDGGREPICLTWGDYRRLGTPDGTVGPEQLLLNDTLVEWYLRFKLEKQLRQLGLAERTYIFSTFFIKRLRLALKRRGETLRKLLKWVAGVDLLSKALLVLPVHEPRLGGHWSLVVVCFPGLVLANAQPAQPGVAEAQAAAASCGGKPCLLFLDSFLQHRGHRQIYGDLRMSSRRRRAASPRLASPHPLQPLATGSSTSTPPRAERSCACRRWRW